MGRVTVTFPSGSNTGGGSHDGNAVLREMKNMNGKRIIGLLAGLMLVLALAGPLAAEEKSFDLTIPGCTS